MLKTYLKNPIKQDDMITMVVLSANMLSVRYNVIVRIVARGLTGSKKTNSKK